MAFGYISKHAWVEIENNKVFLIGEIEDNDFRCKEARKILVVEKEKK